MKSGIRTNLTIFPSITIILILLSTTAIGRETVIYETDSLYHHIRVTQDGNIRGLRFDSNHYQSKIDITDPLDGHFNYVDLLFMGFVFQPEPDNMLLLGLGGGTAQRLINHYQPDLDMLTIELDPKVVEVADEFFFFNSDSIPVEISDARSWLRRNPRKYDFIIQDTYSSNAYGTFIPFHLATLEYFNIVRQNLNDDGVFVINVIGTIYGGEPNRVITSVYRTMHEVFPQLYLFAASDVQNVVIVATLDENRLSQADIMSVANELLETRWREFPSDLVRSSSRYYDTAPSGITSALILTDDYAPTDNLLR